MDELRTVYRRILDIPEIWIRISDYLPHINPCYLLSNHGKVYNELTKSIMPLYDSGGYLKVVSGCINGMSVYYLMHRLVLGLFNPIPGFENMMVNHMDGIKTNNKLNNLEWVDYSENIRHAYKFGLRPRGEDHNWATLTNDQVRLICEGLVLRMSYKDICEQLLQIPYTEQMKSTIGLIRKGQNWKAISSLYDIPEAGRNDQQFTNDQVRYICECLVNKMKTRDILLSMGYKLDTFTKQEIKCIFEIIGRIRRRDRFTEISKDYDF